MIDPRYPDFVRHPGDDARPVLGCGAPTALPPLVQVASVVRADTSGLEDTLRSLQRQSLGRWTWALVDATGGAAPIRAALATVAADPRVRILTPSTDAAEPPLRAAARGEAPYVCLLRPGDLLEPTALETWAWGLATTEGVVAVSGGVVRFGAVQEVVAVHTLGVGCMPGDRRPPPAIMATRQAYEALEGIDPGWNPRREIVGVAQAFAAQGTHVGIVRAPLVWTRIDDPAELDDPELTTFALVDAVRPPAMHPHLAEAPPFANPIAAPGRSAVFVLPYMFHGGAEQASLDQIKILTSRGWRVTVVALSYLDHTWRAAFCAVTPDVHVAGDLAAGCCYWDRTAVEIPRFVSYLVDSRRAEIVVCGASVAAYGIVPWLRRRHPGLAVTAVRHAVDWPRKSAAFLPLLDAVMVSSRTLVDKHRALGVEAAKLYRVPTAIDVHVWRPDAARRADTRAALSLPGNAWVLAYCSRLSADKQPIVFAETLAALRERGLDVYAVVTGNGPDRRRFEARLTELGLGDRVRVLGEVEAAAMPGIIGCADLAFLPSEREGISLFLLEAMACGLPFVGTAEGSQGEVVSEDVGRLVRRSKPDAEVREYTDVLADLLRDPAALAEMGRRARERVSSGWSYEVVGDELETALNEAGQRARVRPIDDDVGVLAHCAAAASLETSAVDLVNHFGYMIRDLTDTLNTLGYDYFGRPLAPSAPVPEAVPDEVRDLEPIEAPECAPAAGDDVAEAASIAELSQRPSVIRSIARRLPFARRAFHVIRAVRQRRTATEGPR